MTKSERSMLVSLTTLYSLIILYFLFVGFGRISNPSTIGYRFNLTPSTVRLGFSQLTGNATWLFNVGNLVAFIPFGILIPLLKQTTYLKFSLAFVSCITVIELIQMITYLGSADIDDVILNTCGATIGYLAYYLSLKLTDRLIRQLIIAGVIAFGLTTVILIGFTWYQAPPFSLNEFA